ncbi:MAG TPA: tetraacyldisaccharide 4'-kinase [Saprospiraceae bacterium]|nr:tetraacyldisaccharide 4'-kinase [Saprospiraceae bacterium]
MRNNLLVRLLLSPFSFLYGIGVGFRNLLYKKGVLRSVSFDLPIIGIGNLSTGGTGKSPHVEYLVRFLRQYLRVGVLSRGYKRRTQGVKFVERNLKVEDVGDEPLQIKIKHPDVVVTVAERRTLAIPSMISKYPALRCIVMDDSFQHRSVKPGLNIMLTTHDEPFYEDYLLPSGNLREWRDGYRRADLIVVTKCPEDLEQSRAEQMRQKINPAPNQRVFFSRYRYGKPYYLLNSRYRLQWTPGLNIILFCAIADTSYLEEYLLDRVDKMHVMSFPDHHYFKQNEIDDLKQRYSSMPGDKKAIITTEKDAVRLIRFSKVLHEAQLPIFVLPVQVEMMFDQDEQFRDHIKQFMLNFTV